MLTNEQIDQAKIRTQYSTLETFHEHYDCIRIAYEWLGAQSRTKGICRVSHPLKHIIEKWGGRYVSQSDVEVAACILGLRGRYPKFNISSRLVEPDIRRLEGINEALSQDYRDRHDPSQYFVREISKT